VLVEVVVVKAAGRTSVMALVIDASERAIAQGRDRAQSGVSMEAILRWLARSLCLSIWKSGD